MTDFNSLVIKVVAILQRKISNVLNLPATIVEINVLEDFFQSYLEPIFPSPPEAFSSSKDPKITFAHFQCFLQHNPSQAITPSLETQFLGKFHQGLSYQKPSIQLNI